MQVVARLVLREDALELAITQFFRQQPAALNNTVLQAVALEQSESLRGVGAQACDFFEPLTLVY